MISFLVAIADGATCTLFLLAGIVMARAPIADMRDPDYVWPVGWFARSYVALWERFLRWRNPEVGE